MGIRGSSTHTHTYRTAANRTCESGCTHAQQSSHASVTCARFGFHGKCKAVTLYDIKKEFEGPLMGNIDYTRDTADGAIRTGTVDLVCVCVRVCMRACERTTGCMVTYTHLRIPNKSSHRWCICTAHQVGR
eukprot:29749-Eustigmatos_ZCMA.PRE.1